ncbi:hypothetical protein D3C71_1439950 [compost metagenome]
MAPGDREVRGQHATRQPHTGAQDACLAGARTECGNGEARTHGHDEQAAERGRQFEHMVRQLVVHEQAHHVQGPDDAANTQSGVRGADAAARWIDRKRRVFNQALAYMNHQRREDPEQQALKQWRKPHRKRQCGVMPD